MEPTLMVGSSRPGFGVRATLRWRELDSNHRFLSKPEVFLPRYVSGYRDHADISRRGSRQVQPFFFCASNHSTEPGCRARMCWMICWSASVKAGSEG